MKTVAAVLFETKRPLELVDLELPALNDGQVLVEISYSGVCHTQLLEARGKRGEDRFLPHCLGHEGVGVVRARGSGVAKVKEQDRVVISWIKGSGADAPGCIYRHSNKKVNAGAVTTFQQFAVVSENRLTRLAHEVDDRAATMLGCALPTGMGSVVNTAQARVGESVVIFGVGGVGACAILGAVATGCDLIVAVDKVPSKLDVARQVGATHVLQATDVDILPRLREIAPEGFDLAIEATGQPAVMRNALEVLRPRGGRSVIVGNAPHGSTLELDPKQFNLGKRVLGTWGGDCDPDRDFKRFERLVSARRVNVAPLLSPDYTLERINDALDDLESGRVLRPIVRMFG